MTPVAPTAARRAAVALALGALVGAAGGCSDGGAPATGAPPASAGAPAAAPAAAGNVTPPANSPDAAPAPATAPDQTATATATAPPVAAAINQASPSPAPSGARPPAASAAAYDPAIVRAEVLLDRAGFSPGAIDGRGGSNLDRALAAFAAAHRLPAGAGLTPAAWNALVSADGGAAMQVYTVTAADLAGPFIGQPPKDYAALARLPALGYSSPLQELAERFHMDPALLTALNPGVDLSKPGARLVVAAPRPDGRTLPVAKVEVDKSQEQVRAYGGDGRLLATYPATVGSTERPAPSGAFAVVAVAPRPAYYYDPKRLTFTPKGATGKLKIAPGPNNPVGSTWIALTVPTYGIHGAPDPSLIGKRQSHGCVRMTNWDVVELGRSVKKGVPVVFVGRDAPAGKTGPARSRTG